MDIPGPSRTFFYLLTVRYCWFIWLFILGTDAPLFFYALLELKHLVFRQTMVRPYLLFPFSSSWAIKLYFKSMECSSWLPPWAKGTVLWSLILFYHICCFLVSHHEQTKLSNHSMQCVFLGHTTTLGLSCYDLWHIICCIISWSSVFPQNVETPNSIFMIILIFIGNVESPNSFTET